MVRIVMEVNAPVGSVPAIKETLAMYLERFGDCRVVEIHETAPQQMGMDGLPHNPQHYSRKNR